MASELTLFFGLRLAIIAVGCLAGLIYFFQRAISPAYSVASIMFLVFVISQAIYVFEAFWPDASFMAHHVIHAGSLVGSFLILPMLFFHLKLLSSVPETIDRRQIAMHLALPGFVLFCVILSILPPEPVLMALKDGVQNIVVAPWMWIPVRTVELLEKFGFLQVVFYFAAIWRLYRHKQMRLQSVFASSRKNESLWAFWIGSLMLLYIAEALISLLFEPSSFIYSLTPMLQTSAVLLFILLVAIWGLRQAPGLYSGFQISAGTNEDSKPKYEKSALALEHAERIAKKLDHAMQVEHLHRCENLSLAKLSQHISSSPNYVSQTLNEHMNTSFFDFINYWRIEDAKALLLTGNDTILAVAYEVGFNSRSAFYSAFKKRTGITPSRFRAENGPSGSKKTSDLAEELMVPKAELNA